MEKPQSPALVQLRKQIDAADKSLVALLVRRMAIVDQIITVKKAQGLPSAIPDRIEHVVKTVRAEALAQNYSPDIAEKLWRILIAETIRYEENALTKDQSRK